MLQFRQNSTLYHTKHSFFIHNTHKYEHGASFTHFYLTAISQHDYHASVQIGGQFVLFNQFCSNKAVAGATVYQRYNIQRLDQLAPFATG